MKLLVVVLIFVGTVLTQPLTKVHIGFDESVGATQVTILEAIFRDYVNFTIPVPLHMDVTNVSQAMPDMRVLFLCSSLAQFDRSTEMSDLMETFVSSGGTLILTAGFNDVRASDVAVWLNDPMIGITSRQYQYEVDDFYNTRRPDGKEEYQALPTDNSLVSSFGRTIDGKWGTPFQRFHDKLYWVSGSTHQMLLDNDNEEFCMFKRMGYLRGTLVPPSEEETCWVFQFPHGAGHVVIEATDFADPSVLDKEFVDDFLSVLTAAAGIHLQDTAFPTKPRNTIMRTDIGFSTFPNILYDLGVSSNVFLWDPNRYASPSFPYLQRMRDITGSDSFVLLDFYDVLKSVRPRDFYFRYREDYADMIRSGVNMVFPGNAYEAARFFNDQFGYTNGNYNFHVSSSFPGSIYSAIFPSEGNVEAEAFNLIDSLNPRRTIRSLRNTYGASNYCQFEVPAEFGSDCVAWSIALEEGSMNFLGWNFDSRYYSDAPYSEIRRSDASWPDESWRRALTAALEPNATAVGNMPVFDIDYLETVSPLNVLLLLDNTYGGYDASINVQRFLEMSSHEVFVWADINDNTELLNDISVNEIDAIVIGNQYPYHSGNADNTLRNFAENGGRVVVFGESVSNNINNLFYQELQTSFHDYKTVIDLTFPYGYDAVSTYRENNLFSTYYDYGRTLPTFFSYNVLSNAFLGDVVYGFDYCAYSIVVPGQYCAVWSKQYGEGDISALAFDFSTSQGSGTKGTYVQGSPWARVLNIAMGADPNDPSHTSTPTPTVSDTPTQSPAHVSPSASGSPVPPSATRTPPPSMSTSGTPAASVTASPSETRSGSITSTNSRSVSPEGEAILVPNSPSPSPIPSPSKGASPSPVRSAPASKSRTIPSQAAAAASPSRSAGIIPSSAGSLDQCTNCGIGEAQVAVNTNQDGNNDASREEVNLVTDTGSNVGSVVIPPNLSPSGAAILDVIFVSNVPKPPNIDLGSVIIDINLRDEFGEIKQLNEPLEICLENPDEDADDACLSFFNTDTRRWECEDECLKKVGDKYCGETDHLTSFALLLDGGGGGGGNDDPCGSNDGDYLFVWLSLAAVALALCCIVFWIIVVEVRFRKQNYERTASFKSMSSRVNQHMS